MKSVNTIVKTMDSEVWAIENSIVFFFVIFQPLQSHSSSTHRDLSQYCIIMYLENDKISHLLFFNIFNYVPESIH